MPTCVNFFWATGYFISSPTFFFWYVQPEPEQTQTISLYLCNDYSLGEERSRNQGQTIKILIWSLQWNRHLKWIHTKNSQETPRRSNKEARKNEEGHTPEPSCYKRSTLSTKNCLCLWTPRFCKQAQRWQQQALLFSMIELETPGNTSDSPNAHAVLEKTYLNLLRKWNTKKPTIWSMLYILKYWKCSKFLLAIYVTIR